MVSIYLYFPPSSQLSHLCLTTVENKGKLILTEIFPSVQKHDLYGSTLTNTERKDPGARFQWRLVKVMEYEQNYSIWCQIMERCFPQQSHYDNTQQYRYLKQQSFQYVITVQLEAKKVHTRSQTSSFSYGVSSNKYCGCILFRTFRNT